MLHSPLEYKSYWRWLPMLMWMGVIFVVSSRQDSQIPSFGWWDLLVKKMLHIAAYALLMILAYWGCRHWREALILTALYAVSDEWHQTFVPTRQGAFLDVLIDMVGALGAWAVYPIWCRDYWPALVQYLRR